MTNSSFLHVYFPQLAYLHHRREPCEDELVEEHETHKHNGREIVHQRILAESNDTHHCQRRAGENAEDAGEHAYTCV